MRHLFLTIFIFFVTAFSAECKDFIVDFVKEHYKETKAPFSYHPVIYHAMQIDSAAGPKLIILKGDNHTHRKWVREYIAQNKQFILRIDDSQSEMFVASKAFELDIDRVHPVNMKRWINPDESERRTKTMEGDNYILILDSDEKRTRLVRTIVKRKGYRLLIAKPGQNSLQPVKLQPEKFKLVIAHHRILASESNDNLIDDLVNINRDLPVLIASGYRNDSLRRAYESKYAKYPSVTIRPMILQELSKMIDRLISGNV